VSLYAQIKNAIEDYEHDEANNERNMTVPELIELLRGIKDAMDNGYNLY